MKKIIIATLLIISTAFFLNSCKSPILPDYPELLYSEEGARLAARDYVEMNQEYKKMKGYHLEEIDTEILECEGCFDVSFEFRIRPETDDYDTIEVGHAVVQIRSGAITEAIFNNKNSKEDTFCIELYKPVCGKIQVQCIRAPCDPVWETFLNDCFAKKAGALEIEEGECQ